jgi:hypothetical protein
MNGKETLYPLRIIFFFFNKKKKKQRNQFRWMGMRKVYSVLTLRSKNLPNCATTIPSHWIIFSQHACYDGDGDDGGY